MDDYNRITSFFSPSSIFVRIVSGPSSVYIKFIYIYGYIYRSLLVFIVEILRPRIQCNAGRDDNDDDAVDDEMFHIYILINR